MRIDYFTEPASVELQAGAYVWGLQDANPRGGHGDTLTAIAFGEAYRAHAEDFRAGRSVFRRNIPDAYLRFRHGQSIARRMLEIINADHAYALTVNPPQANPRYGLRPVSLRKTVSLYKRPAHELGACSGCAA